MPFATAGSILALDSAAVATTGSAFSKWFNVQPGFSFTTWWKAHVTSGAPELTFAIHISPLTETIGQTTVDLTKYVVVSLATGVTTQDTLLRYVSTSLDSPFCQCRLVVTGTGSNDATTTVTAYLTQFN